jgi:hypothetical protein
MACWGPADLMAGKLEVGELLVLGPAGEVPRLSVTVGAVGGEPSVEVALPSRLQGEPVGGEPVEQLQRAAQVPHQVRGLDRGRLGAPVAAAKAAQHVPDRVAPQEVLLVGVVALPDGAGNRLLQPGHVFVADGQRAGGDEDRAQVFERLGVRQFVERFVGERAVGGGELAQDGGAGVLGQPGQHGVGLFGVQQVVVQRRQLGPDAPGAVVEEFA